MGRVYASADWHGCAKPAMKLLDYLQPDDKLYFLGDSIDRGPDGFMLLQLLLKDPRVIYLMGNHEDMLATYLPCYMKDDPEYLRKDKLDYDCWFSNGGRSTWKSISLNCTKKYQEDLVKIINNLSYRAEYISPLGHIVILEHAGFTPFISTNKHDPLWDREHFSDTWCAPNHLMEYVDNFDNLNTIYLDKVFMVHGHTPVQYLKFYYGYKDQPPVTKQDLIEKKQFMKGNIDNEEIIKPSIIRYCGGHKFDIDMCTIATKRVALLDLDTFEEIYFDE